jgi:hypothetical protein
LTAAAVPVSSAAAVDLAVGVTVGVRVTVAVRVTGGVRVTVAVRVTVGVRVGVAAAAQIGPVMELPSVVKELFSDMIRPPTVAPETNVTSADAMSVPTNVLLEAMVADRPICQNTWQGCALPAMTTEPENVMSRPTWKTQTSL